MTIITVTIDTEKQRVVPVEKSGSTIALCAKPLIFDPSRVYPDGSQEWSEREMGFYVGFDPEEPEEDRYMASWGEGDPETFPTLDEAQQWCQNEADEWVRKTAFAAAPACPQAEVSADGVLPCPFCGCAPKAGWQGTGVPGMDDCGYYGIDCCHAFAHADDEQEAVAAWNHRTPHSDAADARRIDALNAWAEEGIVTIGVEIDGGVHVTIEPLGGTVTAARHQSSVRSAIDTAIRAGGGE